MTDQPHLPDTTGAPPGDLVAPTDQERNWATAAHLGAFVSAWFALGLVAPLIVLIVKGNDSPYIRRQSVESLNFQINALIWIVSSVILMFVLIGFVMIVVYGIFYLVVVIMGGTAASQGRDFRYPLTIRFVN